MLFSKAEAASVQVSPLGNHLAWLARVNGVLNLYIAPLPLPPASGGGAAANKIPGARQLTAAVNRDICFYYTFTRDDKRIIYLREMEHGSELYHIYSINLEELDASSPPCASGVDLLANYPQLTCCVGFVGNLQLWLPRTDPSLVILATGRGSLLWDLSALDLRTQGACTLTPLATNAAGSRLGLASLAVRLLVHLAVGLCLRLLSILSIGLCDATLGALERSLSPAPSAAVQYFVDRKGELIGTASAALTLPALGGLARPTPAPTASSTASSIASSSSASSTASSSSLGRRLVPEIALRFTKRRRRRWSWPFAPSAFEPACPDVPFSRLNMQLVGSGGAQGKMRFEEVSGGGVALHACDVADTTAYCVHHDASGRAPPTILAHDPRADIDGFLSSPRTGSLEAILVTHARTEVVPLNDEGKEVARLLGEVRDSLLCGEDGGGDASLEVLPASRTLADDLWVVRTSGDRTPITYHLLTPPGAGAATGAATGASGGRASGMVPRELLCARPSLRGLPLAPVAAVTITARDSEPLPAYLTRATRKGDELPPLALYIHGGPNARDYAGFDPVTQLLAARGISTLQLNYRGSTGYGNRFYNLAIGNVQGMHDDVEDARRWAIDSGQCLRTHMRPAGSPHLRPCSAHTLPMRPPHAFWVFMFSRARRVRARQAWRTRSASRLWGPRGAATWPSAVPPRLLPAPPRRRLPARRRERMAQGRRRAVGGGTRPSWRSCRWWPWARATHRPPSGATRSSRSTGISSTARPCHATVRRRRRSLRSTGWTAWTRGFSCCSCMGSGTRACRGSTAIWWRRPHGPGASWARTSPTRTRATPSAVSPTSSTSGTGSSASSAARFRCPSRRSSTRR